MTEKKTPTLMDILESEEVCTFIRQMRELGNTDQEISVAVRGVILEVMSEMPEAFQDAHTPENIHVEIEGDKVKGLYTIVGEVDGETSS